MIRANSCIIKTQDPSRDHMATGDLGPVLVVSANRMRRDLKIGGSVYAPQSTWNSPEIDRREDGSVWLEICPRESSVAGPAFYWQESETIFVDGSLPDYQLWNMAADILTDRVLALQLRLANPLRWHAIGTWRVGFVGFCGSRPSVVPGWGHSARSLSCNHVPAHFAAEHKSGERLRFVARWQNDGGPYRQVLGIDSYNWHGSFREPPKYLTEWILGRFF